MQRLIEILFGLEKGFLAQQGEWSIDFNPVWPFKESIGAPVWNFVLGLAAVALVVYVYKREGRARTVRILLGGVRLMLILFVVLMLNRPVITLTQTRSEASVVAIGIDRSLSMSVPDMTGPDGLPATRLQAALALLDGEDQKLIRELARRHTLRFFVFDKSAEEIGQVVREHEKKGTFVIYDPELRRRFWAYYTTMGHAEMPDGAKFLETPWWLQKKP